MRRSSSATSTASSAGPQRLVGLTLVGQRFNYPTLAESYKVAALDAMNKLRDMSHLDG